MSYNGHKNHATWLVYVWEVIPLLAHEANEQSVLPEWEGVTYEWARETFDELIVCPNTPDDGIIQDFVNAALLSIDWYSVAEDVKEYINENYEQ